jgi:uncharacterized protein YndB with AHSA1/START domain
VARWTVTRTIAAPIEAVFSAISDVTRFQQVRPQVTRIEFLGDARSGIGTRFRETRRMKDKESTTELVITEYQPPNRVRFVADTHGTVWDSIYTATEQNRSTILTLTMEGTSQRLLPRIMMFMISSVLQTALERDMDAVKSYCEGNFAQPR